MFLGMAIGPALGGWTSGRMGSPVPVFYISCVSISPNPLLSNKRLIAGHRVYVPWP